MGPHARPSDSRQCGIPRALFINRYKISAAPKPRSSSTAIHAQIREQTGHVTHEVLAPTASINMRSAGLHEVTRLLAEWRGGSERAMTDLMPLVYGELRGLAAAYLRGERRGHTLEPTALVHEAYLRLVDQSSLDWQSRSHFYAVAARVMRQILVDHARRKQAKKRSGARLAPEQTPVIHPDPSCELVALDDSLTDLEKLDARKCQAIELRYFAGLTMDEIAQAMNLSVETVRRDMRMAEAWLHDAMTSA